MSIYFRELNPSVYSGPGVYEPCFYSDKGFSIPCILNVLLESIDDHNKICPHVILLTRNDLKIL